MLACRVERLTVTCDVKRLTNLQLLQFQGVENYERFCVEQFL